jgi:hypothetical protein
VNRSAAATVAAAAVSLAQSAAMAQVPPGYAFDKPRVLVQQLVWGRLHGVRLLALACRDLGDGKAALAYADWLESQSLPVAAAEHALARHYFGVDTVPMEAIDGALNLKPSLDVPADELAAACATFPEALAAPRYDLGKFHAERRAAIQRGDPEFHGIVWPEEP